jgi:LysR family glycine cleavage system transcriptional activator
VTSEIRVHPLLRRVERLQLLAVFEAAARRGSFTAAADELGLTQSAISQQITQLEKRMSVRLFDRGANRVRLNPVGNSLFYAVQAGFSEIERGLELISPRAETFVLAANPGFAQVWLVPHLDSLRSVFGEVQLHLQLFDRDSDLLINRFDAAIHLCPDADVPPGSTRLFGEEAVPVASPRYAATHELTADTSPEKLSQADLLHLDVRDRQWTNWSSWFHRHGIAWSEDNAQLIYNNHALVIEDAMSGRGVALGWLGLVDAALEDGRLVAVGAPLQNAKGGYHVIAAEGVNVERLDTLAAWLAKTLGTILVQ